MPAIVKEWQRSLNTSVWKLYGKVLNVHCSLFGLVDRNSGPLCAALAVAKPIAYIWNPNLLVKGVKRAASTTATNKRNLN